MPAKKKAENAPETCDDLLDRMRAAGTGQDKIDAAYQFLEREKHKRDPDGDIARKAREAEEDEPTFEDYDITPEDLIDAFSTHDPHLNLPPAWTEATVKKARDLLAGKPVEEVARGVPPPREFATIKTRVPNTPPLPDDEGDPEMQHDELTPDPSGEVKKPKPGRSTAKDKKAKDAKKGDKAPEDTGAEGGFDLDPQEPGR